jgi:hypothetical protein
MDNNKIAIEILEMLDSVMNNEIFVNYEDNEKDFNLRIKSYVKIIKQVLDKHYNIKIKKGIVK